MRQYRGVLAVVITAVVIVAALLLSRRVRERPPGEQDEPDAPVWALFRAQRQADVRAYLAQLGGEARTGAEQTVREMGSRAFGDYLRRRDADIKGMAIKGREEQGDGSVTLLVDLVYSDGQEEHRFQVRRERGRWRITKVTGGVRHPSLIPYGTPVAPLEAGEADEAQRTPGGPDASDG